MLQFARCGRWLLPLMLLLMVVIVQVCMPAGGSERGDQRPSRSKLEELEEYEGNDYETEAPLEELLETEHEAVTSRSRKPFRRYYNQKNFLLLPLILVGIAAAYAAAGYIVQRSRPTSEGRWSLFSRKGGEKSAGWFPWLSRGKRPSEEKSGETLQQLVQTGRRYLAPAAALALAIGVSSMVYNQQAFKDGGLFFLNSTLFGPPRGTTNPLGDVRLR